MLQPVGAERTRLLIRTRGTYAPRLLGLVMPVLGLYDASYGVAQLRAIRRRAEALTTTPPTDELPISRSRSLNALPGNA